MALLPSRKIRWTLLPVLMALGALVWATEASAATGDLTFDTCFSQNGSGGACTDVPGSVFGGPNSVVVTPDGDSIYVGSGFSSLSHFFFNPTGQLTFDDCFSEDGSGGFCANVPGSAFGSPSGLAISPDGDSLYVASVTSNSVTHFGVGPSGQLTYAGCVSQDGSGGSCVDVPGSAFASPRGLVVSPDGDSLYVAASDSVSHFAAAPAGQLTYAGCVSQDGSGGFCADVPGAAFNGPNKMAMSPDGDSLYVAATFSKSVSHFFAAPAGQLTFGGCVSNDGSGVSCTDVPGSAFDGASGLAMSPDGDAIYVASFDFDSVSHFTAAPAGQITFGDCVSQDGSGGACTNAPGSSLSGLGGLAISSDGRSLYATAGNSNSVNRFLVDPAGRITFGNCASNDGSGGFCSDVPGAAFKFPGAATVSLNGGSVYVAASDSASVSRFSRELSPTPIPPTPVADTTPPELTLRLGKATAGKPVAVTVSCDEACSVDVTGKAKPKGSKKGILKPASVNLDAGQSATLKLKPKGKLRKALRRRGKGMATLAATATDASGNSADVSERVKLK